MLVLTFCIYDYQCNNLTKAYLSHNQSIKQNAKQYGKYVLRTNPETALLVVIGYSSLASEKFRFKVHKNVLLEWKFKQEEQKTVSLSYRYDF